MDYTDADRLYARLLGMENHPKALELGRKLRAVNQEPEIIQRLIAKGIDNIILSAEDDQQKRRAA